MKLLTDNLLWTDNLIEGLVVPYERLSAPWTLDNGRKVFERFSRNAFSDSVARIQNGGKTVLANIEHDAGALMQIGSTASNVQLRNGDDGVYMTLQLLEDTVSDALFKRIKAEIVKGISVEFLLPAGYEPKYSLEGGNYIRTYEVAEFDGFAITANPRYPSTWVAVSETEKTSEPRFVRNVNTDEMARITDEIKTFDAKASLKIREFELNLLRLQQR